MQGHELSGQRRAQRVPWIGLMQLCLEGTLLQTEREGMSQETNPHSNSLSLPHLEHLPLRIFIFCPESKSVCLFIIPPGTVLPVIKTERILEVQRGKAQILKWDLKWIFSSFRKSDHYKLNRRLHTGFCFWLLFLFFF